MSLTQVHAALPHIAIHGERILNVVLVTVTAYHEWGNELGYTCVPVVVFLILNIAFGSLITHE